MIASGHNAVGTTVGLIVASQINDPVNGLTLAILLGLVFHYLFDAIPHGHLLNHEQYRQLPPSLFLDLFGSFTIFYGITLIKFGVSAESLIILAAIGASQAPDVSEGLLEFKKLPRWGILKWENWMHQNIFHWHGQHDRALPWSWKDIWQISLIVFSLIFLLVS